LRLSFARALIKHNPEYRTQLKPFGLMKRDPREKERKKPGLKKARKSPQWSKR
jgi:small subunit ribosomal protein S9